MSEVPSWYMPFGQLECCKFHMEQVVICKSVSQGTLVNFIIRFPIGTRTKHVCAFFFVICKSVSQGTLVNFIIRFPIGTRTKHVCAFFLQLVRLFYRKVLLERMR